MSNEALNPSAQPQQEANNEQEKILSPDVVLAEMMQTLSDIATGQELSARCILATAFIQKLKPATETTKAVYAFDCENFENTWKILSSEYIETTEQETENPQ